MNYLAHLILSNETDDAMLGAVLADFIKGLHAMDVYSAPVQKAIKIHRAVDQFTDTHPLVRQSVARLSKKWGLYSSVLVDMLYDHLLARDWSRWQTEPLRGFADRCYLGLGRNMALMPEEMHYFITRVIQHDVLYSYVGQDGMRTALTRLSGYLRHRLKKEVDLAPAVDDLYLDLGGFVADFSTFWPQLEDHVASEKLKM